MHIKSIGWRNWTLNILILIFWKYKTSRWSSHVVVTRLSLIRLATTFLEITKSEFRMNGYFYTVEFEHKTDLKIDRKWKFDFGKKVFLLFEVYICIYIRVSHEKKILNLVSMFSDTSEVKVLKGPICFWIPLLNAAGYYLFPIIMGLGNWAHPIKKLSRTLSNPLKSL